MGFTEGIGKSMRHYVVSDVVKSIVWLLEVDGWELSGYAHTGTASARASVDRPPSVSKPLLVVGRITLRKDPRGQEMSPILAASHSLDFAGGVKCTSRMCVNPNLVLDMQKMRKAQVQVGERLSSVRSCGSRHCAVIEHIHGD
jgi:hypothetical protein